MQRVIILEYTTVKTETSAEFIERRSRFIGYIKPVTDEESAVEFINQIRAKHWDATHNVYAYSIRNGQICRYSDDGEPSGTAGMPVLSVLTKGGITDAVIVVTRYFGGVLLGAGGLVRAYSHGASIAVEASGLVVMRKCCLCTLSCEYSDYGRVSALIPEMGGVIDDSIFTDRVAIDFHMTEQQLAGLRPRLADATCGACTAEVTGEDYFAFSQQG
ncbi:MAG: YigZ family protein [Clostridia bacterium]|nr:YigZ family protein [Clostridia bacterium]